LGCFWSNLGVGIKPYPEPLSSHSVALLYHSADARGVVSVTLPPWFRPFPAVSGADIAGLWFVLPRSIISSMSI
jgi:hypothetical protein